MRKLFMVLALSASVSAQAFAGCTAPPGCSYNPSTATFIGVISAPSTVLQPGSAIIFSSFVGAPFHWTAVGFGVVPGYNVPLSPPIGGLTMFINPTNATVISGASHVVHIPNNLAFIGVQVHGQDIWFDGLQFGTSGYAVGATVQ